MLTRRSIFGLIGALPAVAAISTQSGIEVEHSQYYVINGDNVKTSCGVQVAAKCTDRQLGPYIAGYEFKISWRTDFLGRGAVESRTHVAPPWAAYFSVETGADASWVQIEVIPLIRSALRTTETVKGLA